jgi:hypothetical protein
MWLGILFNRSPPATLRPRDAEENDAAIFFELETKAPAEGTVLVAEWHQFENGKISHVESAFDGRPYEAMFTSGTPT